MIKTSLFFEELCINTDNRFSVVYKEVTTKRGFAITSSNLTLENI